MKLRYRKNELAPSDATPLEVFGVQLRNHRLRWSMSQREFALKAGLTQTAIAHLEAGRGNPTFDTLQKIAAAFHGDVRVTFVARKRKRVQ